MKRRSRTITSGGYRPRSTLGEKERKGNVMLWTLHQVTRPIPFRKLAPGSAARSFARIDGSSNTMSNVVKPCAAARHGRFCHEFGFAIWLRVRFSPRYPRPSPAVVSYESCFIVEIWIGIMREGVVPAVDSDYSRRPEMSALRAHIPRGGYWSRRREKWVFF